MSFLFCWDILSAERVLREGERGSPGEEGTANGSVIVEEGICWRAHLICEKS
jgi:hypothetical protein